MGALASALGGFEAKESLAFLHQIEFVARDQTQILRTGPQESLLTFVPLQNGLLFRQLIFQILNLRPHFISARSLWKITNCKSGDNEQNDDRSDRPVEGDPDRGRLIRLMLEESIAHKFLAHLSAVNGVVTQLFFNSEQLIIFGNAICSAK